MFQQKKNAADGRGLARRRKSWTVGATSRIIKKTD
jgi:hypothetical protein